MALIQIMKTKFQVTWLHFNQAQVQPSLDLNTDRHRSTIFNLQSHSPPIKFHIMYINLSLCCRSRQESIALILSCSLTLSFVWVPIISHHRSNVQNLRAIVDSIAQDGYGSTMSQIFWMEKLWQLKTALYNRHLHTHRMCSWSTLPFYTSTKSCRGYIFTSVCLSVCVCVRERVCVCVYVCVCVCLSVNKIPAEPMHQFGCDFR